MGSGTDRFAIRAPDVRCVTSSHSWFKSADEFAVARFALICVEKRRIVLFATAPSGLGGPTRPAHDSIPGYWNPRTVAAGGRHRAVGGRRARAPSDAQAVVTTG